MSRGLTLLLLLAAATGAAWLAAANRQIVRLSFDGVPGGLGIDAPLWLLLLGALGAGFLLAALFAAPAAARLRRSLRDERKRAARLTGLVAAESTGPAEKSRGLPRL